MSNTVQVYLDEVIKTFKTGHAREHAYRPALETLVETLNPGINAVNDPKQQKVGAPDFVILKGKTPIGYIEAKDIDVDLDKEFKTKNQFNRYKASLNNLCFTNYLDFRFFLNGVEVQRIEIARLTNGNIEIIPENIPLLDSVLTNFTQKKSITIRSPKELASLMAEKAKMLKNVIYLSLSEVTTEKGPLEQQFDVFKQLLIRDLSLEQYSDIYAQTVAYGMFAARYHDSSLDTFTRDEANNLLPKSNPFLRNFFQTIAGYNIDERIIWIVDDIAELFNHVNVRELLENFGKETKRTDAIVHFYETFLAEYDQKMRKARGVYYTPEPVVDFIVRAVDDILKTEFGIADGLADTSKIEVEKELQGSKKKQKVSEHRVQVLDPATGTGTFLDHIIKHIYKTRFTGQAGAWQSYVDEHLLPRLHGFEILMASYSMAHLKLDITLAETGYEATKGKGKRLGVYLTNSLEEPGAHQQDMLSQWLTTESMEANEVKKEKPIMVVMGNPPYSGVSSNNGEWITKLIEDYKYVDGVHFGERKHWLQDDYVKFIRFAEWFIEKNGEGVIAYINNHGFLDNPTFRGMRNHLLKTFDKIYILDLHGNTKKKETSPDGTKDENVFDIMQGVSINFFIKSKKTKKTLAEVNHADLFGKRDSKYSVLNKSNIGSIQWTRLDYQSPEYFFVYKDNQLKGEYKNYIRIDSIFNRNVSGIVTMGDSFAISDNQESIISRLKDLQNTDYDETTFRTKYTLGKNYAKWIIQNKNTIAIDAEKTMAIAYRPFEKKYTYFDNKVLWRWRTEIMQNYVKGNNIGLLTTKALKDSSFAHAFITTSISEAIYLSGNTGSNAMNFPLYIYTDSQLDTTRRHPNLNQRFIDHIASKLKLNFIPDHEHADSGKEGTFNPLDVLGYIYAILHSPTYRERYKEFLKIDFPRIPFTSNQKLFWSLVEKGRDIRQYHLMEHANSSSLITQYPVAGENEVINPKYSENKAWINDTQYFDSVPKIAWEFYIGGYQPAQKWLKDRKGRKLSFDEVLHYQKIIIALVNTDRVMKEIDSLIKEWPMK